MGQTTSVRRGDGQGSQQAMPESAPEWPGGGADGVGILFYVSPAENGDLLTVAAVEESRADGLLSGAPVRRLKGKAAAAELAAAARAIAGEDMEPGEPPAGHARPAAAGLTGREMQVLTLVARGCTNKRIVVSLGIAEPTVRFHLKSIYAKLQLSSRTEAVAWAVRHGMG